MGNRNGTAGIFDVYPADAHASDVDVDLHREPAAAVLYEVDERRADDDEAGQ